MDERFTDRARNVMRLAEQEARRMRHAYVGAEHILLGLMSEGQGVAANVLENLGLTLDGLRKDVERFVAPESKELSLNALPRTPRANQAVESAREQLPLLKHNYVGTEHLLLGLMQVSDSLAVQVLRDSGVQPQEVRKEVYLLLGHLDLADEVDQP